MKKIKSIMQYTIIALLLIINITIIGSLVTKPNETPNFLGYKVYVIVSGSMQPKINIGDVVIVKKSDNYEQNDIIAFKSDNSVVVHRIIGKNNNEDTEEYETKGDYNNAADLNYTPKTKVEGKYMFKIPKIGYIVLFLYKYFILIIVGIIAIIIIKYIIMNLKGGTKDNGKH